MDIDHLTRVERENLRAAATRALAECCGDCRALLGDQLQHEERGEPWLHIDPEAKDLMATE